MSGFEPDYPGAEVRASPNFGERRGGAKPDALVLHYTGMETEQAAEARLCDPASEVSAHYLVCEDGRVVQLVPEEKRAWHAGKGSWGGADDVNSFSIGIEIVNPGHDLGYPDFPDRQIEAVIALCRDLIRRHGILPQRVLAHSDVAPGRKIDPGEKFPWGLLARAGVGHHVEPAPLHPGRELAKGDQGAQVEAFQKMLARYGYGIKATGFFDAGTEVVTAAFQRHFRPARVDGVADPSTRDTLARLIAALPSDGG
jgi:Negative regulator of beta-lactamase expression